MSDTPETDAESSRIFELTASPGEIFREWEEFARKLERDRNEWKSVAEGKLLGLISETESLIKRIGHAESILSELAGGYWKSILNENDPTGHGDMGDRVIEYWAQCNAEDDAATGEKP